jgi:hypothetical protein
MIRRRHPGNFGEYSTFSSREAITNIVQIGLRVL